MIRNGSIVRFGNSGFLYYVVDGIKSVQYQDQYGYKKYTVYTLNNKHGTIIRARNEDLILITNCFCDYYETKIS